MGTVHERLVRATPERPAQGWYATLVDGRVVFLGDHSGVVFGRIALLREGGSPAFLDPSDLDGSCAPAVSPPPVERPQGSASPHNGMSPPLLGLSVGARAAPPPRAERPQRASAGRVRPEARDGRRIERRGRPRAQLTAEQKRTIERMYAEGKSERRMAIRVQASRRQVRAVIAEESGTKRQPAAAAA